ncbi:DUF502 domain-containing protein [Frigoriflavimonas asaccharolytica]|uniref:Putative membrane protein n=1 Tax=Frigoriflavimonas asaccharolytica TaxID=2735899 RepID=A0A8J8K6L9_9FLAO|nr:DUF502 domain-containing protein [Frigoriflavimonas asaccharolytica]NRS91098.1 putative membrane protein [Frigoriflavimonas asaccharolytica]
MDPFNLEQAKTRKTGLDRFFSLFFKSFLKGLIIIGPIAATIYVLYFIFNTLDNIIPFDLILPENMNLHGLGLITLIAFIAGIGFFFNKFMFGKYLFTSIDQLLEKTPGVKHIYAPTKDVMASFVGDKKKFNRPVWVKTNANPEIWRIGFLTQDEMGDVEKYNYVAVYLPHSYAISGWVIVTEETNIKPVIGMTAAAAMKFAVSGGVAGFHTDEPIFRSQEEI